MPVQTRASRSNGDKPTQNGATKHELDDDSKNKSSKSKSAKVEKNGQTKAVDRSEKSDAKTESKTKSEPQSKAKTEPQSKSEGKAKSNSDSKPGNTPHVVETGILNYFIRGRVEIEEPKSIDEIARGYIVMRPLPKDKDVDLTKRPLPDSLKARLLALPKKQFPHSTGDRFMAFMDATDMAYSELADSFLAPREYETKTAGTRHVPAATPVGEGVYAIIRTDNETHMAYLASLPEEQSEFQRELGFSNQGSFIISSKNPKFPGPAYARLPTPPDYPKDIMDEFGSYSWIPTRPYHLNYKNTQLLLIGHGEKPHLTAGDEKGQEEVKEEMEDMMQKDVKGMRHLSKDESEAIFKDLHAKSKWFHDIPDSLSK